MTEPTRLPDDLNVLAMPAFTDNYLWLVFDSCGDAVAVDPGDGNVVQAHLEQLGLELRAILITHHHSDHIGGAAQLAARYRCPVFGPQDSRIGVIDRVVADGDVITLPRPCMELRVMHVPGHTSSHIAYIGHASAFVGDTLFSVGCGRLFEGSPAEMLNSLDQLAALTPDTLVFCAHEYTLDNARFALDWEPENPLLQARYRDASVRAKNRQPSLPTRIGAELGFNPFLRCDQPGLREKLQQRSTAAITDRLSAFTYLRKLKNSYVAIH